MLFLNLRSSYDFTFIFILFIFINTTNLNRKTKTQTVIESKIDNHNKIIIYNPVHIYFSL